MAAPSHLHLVTAEEEKAPVSGSPPVSGIVLDVLVVDDDADSLRAVHKAVTLMGHSCRVAADGDEAWRMLEARPADVVIADWNMPGLDGAELCRRTRGADAGAPYTYFILMTAFHDREHQLAGMAAGADAYHKKPVGLDELEARLVSAARVVTMHRRVSERTAALRRDARTLFVASRTDALTGAGNRLHLHDELEAVRARAERYGRRYSIALFDVDHFKAYNDHLGHLAGDDALRVVSMTIRAHLRSTDTLFRYGGEEFIVLFPGQTMPDAACAMDRVRKQIEGLALPTPVPPGVLTISAGVAQLDLARDGTQSDWIRRADAALYAAKSAGKNRVRLAGASPTPLAQRRFQR